MKYWLAPNIKNISTLNFVMGSFLLFIQHVPVCVEPNTGLLNCKRTFCGLKGWQSRSKKKDTEFDADISIKNVCSCSCKKVV